MKVYYCTWGYVPPDGVLPELATDPRQETQKESQNSVEQFCHLYTLLISSKGPGRIVFFPFG